MFFPVGFERTKLSPKVENSQKWNHQCQLLLARKRRRMEVISWEIDGLVSLPFDVLRGNTFYFGLTRFAFCVTVCEADALVACVCLTVCLTVCLGTLPTSVLSVWQSLSSLTRAFVSSPCIMLRLFLLFFILLNMICYERKRSLIL